MIRVMMNLQVIDGRACGIENECDVGSRKSENDQEQGITITNQKSPIVLSRLERILLFKRQ